MPSLPITLTPFSAPWMTWVLIALFVIVTVSVLLNGSQVTTGFVTYFQRVERRYTDGIVGPGVGLMMHVFRLASVALALYWGLWSLYAPHTPFRPLPFVILILLTAVVWGVHRLLLWWIMATFSQRNRMQALTNHYLNLWTSLAVVLFVWVLIGSSLSKPTPILYLMGLTVATYPLAVLIKALSVVPLSWRTLLYVPLYVLTVDILPFAALFFVGKTIVTL
jgi:hypothetical protein